MNQETPLFFSSPSEFRKWLEKNHSKEKELIVGYYKVKSGKPSMTWSESVDEALCFGWIDGIRKSIDEESYQIRFTPRKVKSNWSAVNIKKIAELKKKGLMRAAGLKIYELRQESKSEVYSYENGRVELSSEYQNHFKSNPKALKYFEELAPSYKKASISWVMSAKREETRISRLEKLISDSENGVNQFKNRY